MQKTTIHESMTSAVADIPDGIMLMIGGFAGAGFPWNLLSALYNQGAKDLTTVSNGVGFPSDREDARGLGDFVVDGRVKKVIASFTAATRPSRPGTAEVAIRSGEMEADLSPQGTLAERIRSGGAGIPAFYTPAAVGTRVAEGKEVRTFDGRDYVMETALFADYAFIRASRADTAGNLVFRRSAQNFNDPMAMAAEHVIVEVEHPIVPAGEIDPDHIHLPGVYVERLVQIPEDGIIRVQRQATQSPAAAAAEQASAAVARG